MQKKEGIEKLFFELASETRLDILRQLERESAKMQSLNQKLDLTATETFRQLQRLTKAKLVQKQVEGTYSITQLGKLTLTLSSSLEFVYMNKPYFLEHDVWQLPPPFINRIGELSHCVLITKMADTMNVVEKMIREAKDHVWVMTDQVLDAHSRAMAERVKLGVSFRSLLHESLFESIKSYSTKSDVERRYLPNIFGILVVTEKEAGVSFPLASGKADYSGFIGKEAMFLKWASDLYLHYWDQAKLHHLSLSSDSK